MSERETPVLRLAITEPTELDPYRAQEMEGMAITKAPNEGLLALDRRHRVAPGAAQSWEGSADGRRRTFRLRPDGRFSTGEAVTAGSFVRAWNRAADPAAGSETTYHLSGVEGFADRVRGHTDTLSGARALDALTLQITLAEPDHEFDAFARTWPGPWPPKRASCPAPSCR
jgi:oligopeptide transport system substrate-binding protein